MNENEILGSLQAESAMMTSMQPVLKVLLRYHTKVIEKQGKMEHEDYDEILKDVDSHDVIKAIDKINEFFKSGSKMVNSFEMLQKLLYKEDMILIKEIRELHKSTKNIPRIIKGLEKINVAGDSAKVTKENQTKSKQLMVSLEHIRRIILVDEQDLLKSVRKEMSDEQRRIKALWEATQKGEENKTTRDEKELKEIRDKHFVK